LPNPQELDYVRGAHLADNADVEQGWRTTTGRPDVTIAVLDSGIKWDDDSAMVNVRRKTRISKGEAPQPLVDRATATEAGQDCATFGSSGYDRNHDGVFNVVDYACDSRVLPNPPLGVGPTDKLDPQDILIAFSDGDDDDGNGYADDLIGWDFLDDDNDPYDDVQYGHGTGESKDSNAEPDTGDGDAGSCPNCMVIHLRVGTSFVADVNRFAEAAVYATDNNVQVIQEALGTLNKSHAAGAAIKYAYDHGTTVIASAADEAAQHHNWPSSFPYSIVVNSVTRADETGGLPLIDSYLRFNGCTNFSSRITLAIPSVSCSSDATGRAAGMAGLVYSAAKNAVEKGKLVPHGMATCATVAGQACDVTPNEVRQLMASGVVDATPVADDVNFAQTPLGTSTELSCLPVATPVCTDPFLAAPPQGVGAGLRYPARKGHDQFYGYGRVNMAHTLDAVFPSGNAGSKIPPEVEVTSPRWFDMVDPAAQDLTVTGFVDARGGAYSCQVLVAPGSYPGPNDFTAMPSAACDGNPRTGALDGTLATIPMADLKALFPATVQFDAREPGAGAQTYGGRPNTEPYGFVVKVVATAGTRVGQDQRQAYLHRDADMLDGFPRQLPGDAEASPVLADLDGDNENELIIANSDGEIHAFERAGGEVPGWPAHTPALRADHLGAPGWGSGGVDPGGEAVLATPAVGDIDGDGVPEVVVADLDRHVLVFDADGTLRRQLETDPQYAGIPAQPFVNLRHGIRNRTQPGALGAPVLADLDGDHRQEIILASMDRHVYAWHPNGDLVDGWPVLVVDRSKVQSIDPVSHQITFTAPAGGDEEQQGAIVDTPAVGDLDGDGKPEVVVGTNEEYPEPVNAGGLDQALYAPLGAALAPGNGRLFVLKPTGVADPLRLNNDVYQPGWPFPVGILQRGVLPLVGEGVTGSPIIGTPSCQGDGGAPRVGTSAAAGLAYVIDPNGVSCYGKVGGLDRALPTTGAAPADPVFFPAFGHPAFATLAGQTVMMTPAAGVVRAADVVLPDYQGGRDYLAVWNTDAGVLAPGWPAVVNDLQFLTGPSVADIDGLPGQEVLEATANDDLQGLSAAGTPIDPSWPKLTGDWTVMNAVIGPWGDGDKKVIVTGTRNGRLLGYGTGADTCAPADWPQFHHDPANSGDARRDAIAPGHPTSASIADATVTLTATGDDLQCGTAKAYEIVTSDAPIDAAAFAGATPVANDFAPAQAGTVETLALTGALKRYVAVRAVDEQGNVGRPVTLDRGATATPSPTPTVTPTPAKPCSVVLRGTKRADRLRGTKKGDRIFGLRGNDRLHGGGGRDCVYGGRGRDRVFGGQGRDRLFGGPGRDRIGARGARRDVVNCGRGRDVAVVDRTDRVSRCEVVRRR
ncbi:MAG: hypothetical protein QOI80_581, partial [Solirubrobacteraceae bacterium]|nr:hypothetical protein [Solirubrobacteraceae bacterium]